MKKTRKAASLAATLITFGWLAGGANAALVISAVESGGNVVFSWGGGTLADSAIDVSALASSTDVYTEFANPGDNLGSTHAATGGLSSPSEGASFPMNGYNVPPATILSFGVSGRFENGIPFGSPLAIGQNSAPIDTSVSNIFALPATYTSMSILPSGSLTFIGETFASMGLTPTNINWVDWGAPGGDDLIQLQFSPVPEPSSTLLLGFATLCLVARRKRTT